MTDIVTDLQWNINRWYDAKVGRWISEDPIGFEAKDTNLIRYIGNNSISQFDLFGLVTNQYQFRGFYVTNNFSYTYKGQTYTQNMNEIVGGSNTGAPHSWLIAITISLAGSFTAEAEKNTTVGCWSPRFTVEGFTVIVRRPDNNEIVHSIYTNMDIWSSWRSKFASSPLNSYYTFTSSHAEFLTAINNHELNHYNTIVGAIQIIVSGLTQAENMRFMTKQKALNYASKAMNETDRVWQAAASHSSKFDTVETWKINSFFNPNFLPFNIVETFNLPLP
jgi:RHS repeat-associated protein